MWKKWFSVKNFLINLIIVAGIVSMAILNRNSKHLMAPYKAVFNQKELDYEMRSTVENLIEKDKHPVKQSIGNIPHIYVITPTYKRLVQKAELTRLSQTLMHVLHLHWIVVEDSSTKHSLVSSLLENSGLNFTHLNVISRNNTKHRGVDQRNVGLRWLRSNRNLSDIGVVYFADDDNTYDLQIFEEMRSTNSVSIWPVGLVGRLTNEGPICADGKVTGFRAVWGASRTFPIDMAGFAINLKMLLKHPEAKFNLRSKLGYIESDFLKFLITRDELEPRAEMCTKVLVWHTRSMLVELLNEEKIEKKIPPILEI